MSILVSSVVRVSFPIVDPHEMPSTRNCPSFTAKKKTKKPEMEELLLLCHCKTPST
jgi:hypothetical protein